uniref:CCHC-type domain-containing protein n=1 Tax=Romanomermis culicivorax TaxID=13658 RepID=A0A915JS67_ROMCU
MVWCDICHHGHPTIDCKSPCRHCGRAGHRNKDCLLLKRSTPTYQQAWTTGCICYACPVHNPAQIIWRQQVPAQPPIITAVQPAKTKIIKRKQGTIMKKCVNKSSMSTFANKREKKATTFSCKCLRQLTIPLNHD